MRAARSPRDLIVRRHTSGFTLVELVTVIMVLGILSVGTVQFITDSAGGFATTVGRAELATDARFAVERISRELRDALPNSVRSNGACIEYIPIIGASTYTTLPVAAPAASFLSVPVDPLPVPAGARVAVYPNLAVYVLAASGVISPTAAVSGPDGNNEVTVTMATPHSFPAESPSNRYFFVASPVSYCVDGDALWRYQNYGFLAAQPAAAALPGGLPGRSLVAQYVNAATPFTVNAATLTRNAVVEIDLAFTRRDDSIAVQHLVQVRNVP